MQRHTEATDAVGFPAEYTRRLRQARTASIWRLVILITGAGIPVWGAGFLGWPVYWAAIAVAVFLYFGACELFSLRDLRTSHERARLVPYFQSKVPGVDTSFANGHALARNCAKLDEMAVHARVVPLSAFGFADDFIGWGLHRQIPWHDPDQGLRTIECLLREISEHPGLVQEREGVVADLRRIQSRLEEARKLRVRFCFHLRMDSSSTGLEFEQRRGKY